MKPQTPFFLADTQHCENRACGCHWHFTIEVTVQVLKIRHRLSGFQILTELFEMVKMNDDLETVTTITCNTITTIVMYLYHERQRWALCGVHAMNNLLQQAKFSAKDFEQICQELAPDSSPSSWNFAHRNPHCSMWGVGNYDANVMTVLLDREGFQVQWQDNREEVTMQLLEEYYKKGTTNVETFGIVVNMPSSSLLAKFTKGRHWLTLLWQVVQDDKEKQWVNLDSELKEPQVVGDMEACVQLLKEWRSKQECHILLVKKEKPDEKG